MWVERAEATSDLSVLLGTSTCRQKGLAGHIATPPDVDGDRVMFRLAARALHDAITGTDAAIHETVQVRIKLQSREEQRTARLWQRGDAVRIAGTPERPGDSGNFGAFDYREYLERKGIYWQWTVNGADNVQRMDAGVPLHLLPQRMIDAFRQRSAWLVDKLYPGVDGGYMKGLVIGVRDDIDPLQYEQYSRLGLTHILAISGLHVGVVVFVLLRLGALLRFTRERSIDIAFAAMPLYMVVTGASPSAVRACLMAMIALALARRNRLKDGLHLLAAAAIAMVVWDPQVVENISFQLSFVVTAGLLLFTADAARLFAGIRPKFVRDAVAVALTAQAVSLPLTVYYFHSLHLLSLPANLLIVPIVSFAVLPLGMASVVLGAIWLPLGVLPAALAAAVNRAAFRIVELMDRAENLRLSWPQPPLIWVVCTYSLMALTVWLWRRRRAVQAEEALSRLDPDDTMPLVPPKVSLKPLIRKGAIVMLLLLCWGGWGVWSYQPAFLDRHAYVQFLDVGQGDGILIRTGAGNHVLVDVGGAVQFRKPGDEWRERRDPYEIGRKLIVPLLRKRGVRELDALVLTHLDADHIGGAEAVIKDIPVKAIVWNGTWKDNAQTKRLFQAALARGIPVYAAHEGQRWSIDRSAQLIVLAPPTLTYGKTTPDYIPLLDRQNERSIVLLMQIYGRTFLLTGDVETPGERSVIASLAANGQGPRPIDVMKAAHHGSKTSTSEEWLKWWRPAETIVSAGRNNLYGHPHPTVVDRIASAGSLLWRTDEAGEVQYRIDPSGGLHRRTKRAFAGSAVY